MTTHRTDEHRRTEQLRFGPILIDFDDRVLRPRAWTIMQSTWAAELAATAPPGPMLELCAGAGQIGLAAAVLAGRDLVQVELDPVAAMFAAHNARTAGHAARTEIRVGAMQDVLADDEQFGLILADPPYLPSDEVARWPEDPVTAIDGGVDGLEVLRTCLGIGARHLLPDGQLLLQVAGPGQAAQLATELPAQLCVREIRAADEQRAVVRLTRRR